MTITRRTAIGSAAIASGLFTETAWAAPIQTAFGQAPSAGSASNSESQVSRPKLLEQIAGNLPRQKVELVPPPFVHAHEQATKQGPKILEFRLVTEEKRVVIDDEGTTLQAMTFNGSIPPLSWSFMRVITSKLPW